MSDLTPSNDTGYRNSSLLPLFEKPFYSDWIIWLAVVAVVASTSNAANSYGPIFKSTPGVDIEPFFWDVTFAVALQTCFFGFIPALIRRKVRERRMRREVTAGNMKPDLHLGVVVGVCLTAALGTIGVVEASKDYTAPLGSALSTGGREESLLDVSERECRPVGQDTMCISGIMTRSGRIEVESEWRYSVQRTIDGFNVSEFRWTTTLDCGARTGSISGLAAYSSTGYRLPLSPALLSEIAEGMQRDQVPQILDAC